MKRIIIVQARMTSTRLPGKVLMELCGKPMLHHQLQRLKRCTMVEEIVVATTTNQADDPIVTMTKECNLNYFRGSEQDVLSRFMGAAITFSADVIIRITSDCPLIEPTIIDQVVQEFQKNQCDYASNSLHPRTFPRGLDVEVFSFAALEQANKEDYNPAWREHVTPYLYCYPEKFRLLAIVNDIDYSTMRWTVDTPEDFDFVQAIYQAFHCDNTFSWNDVIHLLTIHPEWIAINAHIQQKEVF